MRRDIFSYAEAGAALTRGGVRGGMLGSPQRPMESQPSSPSPRPAPAHSEDYFNDYRDFWWNADFLELMGRRLGIASRRQVLEVGCGAGHWTRAYAPLLAPGATITAVDRDPKWAQADAPWTRALAERGVPVTVQAGDAGALPFADGSFDFVTCQTVLIHVARPEVALREMLRVLRPGGLLLCVEPDNFGTFAAATALNASATPEELVEEFRFALSQDRGRKVRGESYVSLGGRLPAMVAAAGIADVRVYLSDKVVPLYPPYAKAEQRAVLDALEQWYAGGVDFSREEARQRFLASGGAAGEFEAAWAGELARRQKYREAVRTGTYDDAGACLMYLVAGTKAQG